MIEAGKLTEKVEIFNRELTEDAWGSEKIAYISRLVTRANVITESGSVISPDDNMQRRYTLSVLCRKCRVSDWDLVLWRNQYYQVDTVIPTMERDGQFIKCHTIDTTLFNASIGHEWKVQFFVGNAKLSYLFAEVTTELDGSYIIPEDSPTKDGYNFMGWYTLPNGEGDKVEVIKGEGDGDEDTLPVTSRDLKLYAYMEEDVRDEAEVILRNMPTSIRSALVAWFSPFYQHLTNEEFAVHPYLIDLCGSNLTLQATNFNYTEASGIYDSGVVLDGVNDRLRTSSNVSSQTAGISLFLRSNTQQRSRFIIEQRVSTQVGTGAWTYLLESPTSSGANNRNSSEAFYVEGKRGTSFDAMPHFDSLDAFRMHMLNDNITTYPNNLTIGCSGGNANFASMTLYGMMIWNRSLSAKEVQWVERVMMKDHREEHVEDTLRDKLLNALSASVRSALVAWYDPAVQELTNEKILARDTALINLQGNDANDLTLYNFSGTATSGVNGDWGLVFNNKNNYAQTNTFTGLDAGQYTVFFHHEGASRPQTSRASVCHGTGVEGA